VLSVTVVLVTVAVVEVMQLNSLSYALKPADTESSGAPENRRHDPFESRYVKNEQNSWDEHSVAQTLAVLVCCESMSKSLFACFVSSNIS
jgi:hypothetical protein